jgi:chlorite dismutase
MPLGLMSSHGHSHSESPKIDVLEHGAPRGGQPQDSTRRLFVQLVALECPRAPGADNLAKTLFDSLNEQSLSGAVYADVHHPWGLAVVVMQENPDELATKLRATFANPQLPEALRVRSEYAMLGRTYSSGFEPDLEDWLLHRPRRTLLDPANQFGIWYPLRRKGRFERLEPKEKGEILREHGGIGRAYGDQNLAHDIRLACHGLDPNDNDFVIGLLGEELHPLSHVVQAMRRTRQTAEYMEKMGPFFVGRVLYRTPL